MGVNVLFLADSGFILRKQESSLEKVKVKLTQSCLTLCHSRQSMKLSRPEYWSGQPFPSPVDLPNPGIEPRSPALQEDSLPADPQGKPKNTRVSSLFLLQQLFLIQESNWGFLHCRRIFYQLSYQGSHHKVDMLFLFLNT